MPTVSLNKMIEKLELKNLTPEVSTEGIEISSPDINRPALQLAGYFELQSLQKAAETFH